MKQPTLTNVKSSNVDAIGWKEGSLYVRFKSGGTYRYVDVPEAVYHQGLGAESPGKWFRNSISGTYIHKKHDA